MKIKRSQIIKALKTEPLQSNYWIQVDYGYYQEDHPEMMNIHNKIAKQLKCVVCAVGAVLRGCTKKTVDQIENYGFRLSRHDLEGLQTTIEWENISKSQIRELVMDKKYMAALSGYFESTIPKTGAYGKRHRERLVRFVKKNFPAEIKI